MDAKHLPQVPILLVDDEEQALSSYDLTLRYNGLANTVRCSDSRRVKDLLSEREYSLVMLDLCMPHVGGEELLDYICGEYPETPVIVVTGYNEIETAVRCMRTGSIDYLVKPVDRDRLLPAVRHALELRGATLDPGQLPEHRDMANSEVFAHIVSRSRKMNSIYRYIGAIAATEEPVLITGETGVGKEMVARAIHIASRRSGRFVAVNAAGLDDTMFADALFGHRRGAFTGAMTDRDGLVEKAAGGSLFLDEVGDLGQASQIKLLRLIQEREYYPLGSDSCRTSDARLVVATNLLLDDLLDTARFRRDLFYRLRVHHIHVPALRERMDDVPLLVEHFLDETAKKLGKRKPAAPRELLSLLYAYDFPGNIRELEAMVFDAVARHDSGKLPLEPFRAWIATSRSAAAVAPDAPPYESGPLPTLREAEERLIEDALRLADGNQSVAARVLGITRQSLNRRLLTRKRKSL